ncbi:uncharacterized protein J3D65DRAFT_560260 [Phyllosticta citribraziliensis]|uniref:DUF6594 domain-containing protein n=1 Tax=Phyllosticta citribraziliensis TaxID=989973 RepID=A0ABR1LAM5_9PEZI
MSTAASTTAASTTPSNDLPAGYPRLAARMGLQPELAIFRRFGFLNKLNILCLQAELAAIEEDLKLLLCTQSQVSSESLLRDWGTARKSADEREDDGRDPRLNLILAAGEKLEKYSELTSCVATDAAVVQQSRMLAMDPPKKNDLDYIQRFIGDESQMGFPHPFSGADSEIWGSIESPKGHANDIITPYPYRQKDMFSKLVKKKFFDFGFDRVWRSCKIGDLEFWDEKVIDRMTSMVSTALASILPIISIIILYYVESMEAKFGIMAVFNILISVCLGLLTHAKRSEIFAVTAAFSAIQVVFVQAGDATQANPAGS